MKLSHEKLMQVTESMPMKLIRINGEPYLERYYAGTFADDHDLWLHRFITSDGELHLHSHGFEFKTVMLCGAYTEEFLTEKGTRDWRFVTPPNYYREIDSNLEKHLHRMRCEIKECRKNHGVFLSEAIEFISVNFGHWHRIAKTDENTWTACIVAPERRPEWLFIDDDKNTIVNQSSPRDWWKRYKPRPDDGIVIGDNSLRQPRLNDIYIGGEINKDLA